MMFRKSEKEWDTLRDLKIGYVSLRRFAPLVDAAQSLYSCEWGIAGSNRFLANPCFTEDLD